MKFLLFLLLISPLVEAKLSYVFGILLFLLIIFKNVNNRRDTVSLSSLSFVMLASAVCISWGYGVFVGIYNDVNTEYVFSNFLGLTLYIFLPVLIFCGLSKSFVKIILNAGLVVAAWSAYVFMDIVLGGRSLEIENGSVSSIRVFMSVTQLYMGPLISVCLFRYTVSHDKFIRFCDFFSVKKDFFNLKWLFLYAFILIVPAVSKGFILVFLVIFVFFIIFSLLLNFKVYSPVKFMVFSLCLLSLLAVFVSENAELIDSTFESSNQSNSLRSEQYDYLVAEITPWGAGLGASLESGYKRDDTGYGFELTFLNVAHKLGIFALPLFLLYILTFFKILQALWKADSRLVGAFCLGGMLYIIPGSANPMLLAPNLVVFHVFSILLLDNRFMKGYEVTK